MKKWYVVVDEKEPYIVYYNEHPEGSEEEIMSLDHAIYTASELNNCQIMELVPYIVSGDSE